MQDISYFRSLFPHLNNTQKSIYFNHAALSPLPKSATNAIMENLESRQCGEIDAFEQIFPIINATRQMLSDLISANSADDIAFMPNTSFGLSAIAAGLPLEAGDRILVYEQEFPSNVYPWLSLLEKGIEVDFIPANIFRLNAATVEQYIRPKTKLFSVSAVQFLSGYPAPLQELGELCKANNMYFIVDAIQAAGNRPVNVQNAGIDALCCGCHKWLMGAQGLGFMYAGEQLRQELKLVSKGWLSVENIWDLFNTKQKLHPGMQRFEPGTFNLPAISGLHESLKIIKIANPEIIAEHTLNLGNHLMTGLQKAGFRLYGNFERPQSAISSYKIPDKIDPRNLYNKLKENDIHVSIRNELIRFSPYFYNTRYEADAIMEQINTIVRA
ncbi:MAG: aminotransferase class V-fold PLP-dependent enzyme [Balneolales bacterium]|nr:aminotransferase class V-fold PLP-dependent enzyme [Balneolales bacterium]